MVNDDWLTDALIESELDKSLRHDFDPKWDKEKKIEYGMDIFRAYKHAAKYHTNQTMVKHYNEWAEAIRGVVIQLIDG